MWKKSLVLCLVGLLTVGFLVGIGSAQEEKSTEVKLQPTPVVKGSYSLHAPIRINNDTDFDSQFPGREISGYEINGSGKSFCIFIGNCSQEFTVKDCYLHNASGRLVNYFRETGLYLYNSSNGTLYGNKCSVNCEGIYMDSSNSNTLTKNTCSANTYNGICLMYSINNMQINNTCSSNLNWGIYLDHSNSNTLTGNVCNNNVWNGIQLGFSNSNMLTHNICSMNEYSGIRFYYSNENILTNNNCSVNYGNGLELGISNRNAIEYNKMDSNSGCGILISSPYVPSSYNSIHHNYFINNNGAGSTYDTAHVQAYDQNGTNFWNTSTEGNYWSDWTSPDNNHNGIVDYSYNITGGAKDYYPLTTQVIIPEFIISPLTIILSILLFTSVFVTIRKRLY